MVDRIYPAEFQLNKANSSNTKAPFLDLNLSISNDTLSTKWVTDRLNMTLAVDRAVKPQHKQIN